MAYILCIETSTEVCSVALSVDGTVLALREDKSGKNHALLLTQFIQEVLTEMKLTSDRLSAVAVSGGPGSYTGLRIGVSTAKGLCYAARIPLIAIPSLEILAHHIINNSKIYGLEKDDSVLYCPMIDARRMEVYAAVYDRNLKKVRDVRADVIDHSSFMSLLQDRKVVFLGNGADKCRMTIGHPNAIFLDKVSLSAGYMAGLAELAWLSADFADVAYYEPFYLKDFVATVPTKNVFHASKNNQADFS
jgi:tRNA threonylcarbamoyladenosine biosynthesis protein TsaB